MVDLEKYHADSLARWDRFAANWDEERDFLQTALSPVGARLVERLDPKSGDTVLELAAGTGDTGLGAAERIGDEGKLISTDFAPSMVESARGEGERRGLTNVDFRVLDAERMDLEDSSVDGVLCRFGYMLMGDPAAALAETRRVLRDDGRLSFAVWGPPLRNLWAAIPGMTMVELGHLPPPEPGAPGIFAMSEADRVRELVTGAGFSEPQIEEISVSYGYADPDEHWAKTLKFAAPIADAFAGIDESGQEQVRAAVRERVEERLAEDEAALDGVVLAVLCE
jgi:SAM-dependent methyltransferase